MLHNHSKQRFARELHTVKPIGFSFYCWSTAMIRRTCDVLAQAGAKQIILKCFERRLLKN